MKPAWEKAPQLKSTYPRYILDRPGQRGLKDVFLQHFWTFRSGYHFWWISSAGYLSVETTLEFTNIS